MRSWTHWDAFWPGWLQSFDRDWQLWRWWYQGLVIKDAQCPPWALQLPGLPRTSSLVGFLFTFNSWSGGQWTGSWVRRVTFRFQGHLDSNGELWAVRAEGGQPVVYWVQARTFLVIHNKIQNTNPALVKSPWTRINAVPRFKQRQWSVKLEFSDFISHKLFFRHKFITPWSRRKGRASAAAWLLRPWMWIEPLYISTTNKLKADYDLIVCWLLLDGPQCFCENYFKLRPVPASSNPLTVWRIKVLFKSLRDFAGGAGAWPAVAALVATIFTLWWDCSGFQGRESGGASRGSPLKYTKLWRGE